ncbi:MAG TPA: universal stress protein [Methanotrichaceae archaeon]|nr:universal stress protein [Methanotrichaceae archaeon]
MFERIIIATDGSRYSEHAAEMGIGLAKLSGGKVIALFVADTGRYLPTIGDLGLSIPDGVMGSIRDEVLRSGRTAVGRVEEMARNSGVPSESAVVEGYPAEEIIEAAKNRTADLIVMGSMGKTGLDRFLLGSVAEKVVKNSRTSVLIVHT